MADGEANVDVDVDTIEEEEVEEEDRNVEENLPPGMDENVLSELKYDHSMHYSKVFLHLFCLVCFCFFFP
jgi:hypothetical protein